MNASRMGAWVRDIPSNLVRWNGELERIFGLEEGTFGYCFECGDDIAQQRLRALPFAVRCKDCEQARENAIQRERLQSQRSSSLFFDISG